MMNKILLVEDDSQIAKSLSLNLSLSGYEVATADSVSAAQVKVSQNSYDLLLLDVGLPDGSGIDFCRQLRGAGSDVPILFLSARTDEETVVRGISSGGDDYIRKPFGTEELKVRMNKLLQRAAAAEKSNLIHAGPLALNLDHRSAVVDGQPLTLGKREFDILAILARKKGDVVTREMILQGLQENAELYDRTIDSHMSHLRKKIRDAAGITLQIVAVYGVGYRLQWSQQVARAL